MKKYLIYSKTKFTLLVVLKAIYAAAFVGFALILQWLVNIVTAPSADVESFLIGVGVTIAYVALFTVLMLLKDRASSGYINKAVMRLRDDLTKNLLEENYEDFVKNDTAKYLSHLTNDIKTISASYFTSMMTLPEEIFTFIFAVAAAFTINYIVALTMLGLTLLIFIVPIAFNKPLNNANVRLSSAIKDYTSILKQTFLGIDVVKNFGSEERMQEAIGEINRNLTKKNTLLDRLNLYASDTGIFIVVLLQLGSIAIAGYMLLQNVILIGAVIAVVQLSGNMYSPLMQIAGKAALISGVRELNKTLLCMSQKKQKGTKELCGFESAIKVRSLRYAYQNEGEPILKNVNAEFEKGKKYLIIGRSGSGKSTLLKLIGKLYESYEGEIEIDGTNYRDISENALYNVAGFAQQKSYLFDRSVRENIDFNQTGDETLLCEAIKNAELETFVSSLPCGLDEMVGEEVKQTSGGEKQRIALARALYKNSDILLLDEITSSLDRETARKIEENILRLPQKTVLNVSHKLHSDLLKLYDRVVIMENGEIADFDTPQNLFKQNKLEQFLSVENE